MAKIMINGVPVAEFHAVTWTLGIRIPPAHTIKVRRIFYKDSKKRTIVTTENLDTDIVNLPKVAVLEGKFYEFIMYQKMNPEYDECDWELKYSFMGDDLSKYSHHKYTDIEDMDARCPPSECDCGVKHTGGKHSHWCSTRAQSGWENW